MNKGTRKLPNATAHPVDLSQHAKRCTICSHPDREAIEEAFLQWRSPFHLVSEFKLPCRTALYRHANAFGLFEQRRRNVRYALENIIEESERARPTANEVIAAVRAYACLQDNGEWLEPVTSHRVITGVTPGTTLAFAASNVGTAAQAISAVNSPAANMESLSGMDANTQRPPIAVRTQQSEDSVPVDTLISGQKPENLIATPCEQKSL